MKVLHVIPSLSPVHGGPTHALAMMERALKAQGVEVETVTTDDDGPSRRNGKMLGKALAENGVVRRYFAKRSELYKVSPAFARWITREVRQYDVVHIHALFSFTSSVTSWAARRAGVPYIIRPLGTLGTYGMTQRRARLKSLSMQWIEGPALRHAAAVHFTSIQEAEEARGLGLPLKGVIVPLGVEPPMNVAARGLLHRQPGTSPRVLFLSRIDPKKNLEGLLDAVAILAKEIPGLCLLVAGNGSPSYVAGLRARAESLGLPNRVTWVGHLAGDAKSAAFGNADLFVLPSFSENFGIAAAEALAHGLPCVLGCGVAIADEAVQAGAGIATTTDAPAIADAMRRIITDNPGRTLMAARAQELAQRRFSATLMGARLKQLYLDILGNRRQ